MYRKRGEAGTFRACTAIGDQLLDLVAVDAEYKGDLNALASEGRGQWQQLRHALSKALSQADERGRGRAIFGVYARGRTRRAGHAA
jgi:hypothetical protein